MLRTLFWSAVTALGLALAACTMTVQPPAGGTMTPADGSATPPAADLVGPTWEWVETVYADGTRVTAADPSRYTLTFGADGQVAAQLDCNSGGGSYSVDGEKLVFGALASTLMGCPNDSQDFIFSQDLSAVVAWVVEDGALRLELADEGGTMHFRAAP